VKVGDRLHSVVCDTEVIIIRATAAEVDLTCGGYLMEPTSAQKPDPAPRIRSDQGEGSLLGKRYEDEVSGLELLVTKAGSGSLYVDGHALLLKSAKRLPSSD
jgi:hypothetical protein